MRYIYCAPDGAESKQKQGIKDFLAVRSIYWGDCTNLLSDVEYDDPTYDSGIKFILSTLDEGDVLYVWDFSALGKTLGDLYTNLLVCSNKGVSVVQCLDGEVVGGSTDESDAVIRGIGIASRIRFNSIQRGTKKALEERKRQISENGGFISKSGRWVTALGPGKIGDRTKAARAGGAAQKALKKEWQKNSVGYQWVMEQLKLGVPRTQIIKEFNRRREINPEDYSTRKGTPLSQPILTLWIQEAEEKQE